MGPSDRTRVIQQECEKHGIIWHHLPLIGAFLERLFDQYKDIVRSVNWLHRTMAKSRQRVLIHCAAGIHRTGVVAYSLLRATGLCKEEAMGKIKAMREATFNGVGKARILGSEKHVIPLLNKKIQVSARPIE